MSIRKTIAGIVVAVACTAALTPNAAVASGRGVNQPVLGVGSGTARVNVATLEVSAELKVLLTHFGAGTASFAAQGVSSEGVVRATGPFSIVGAHGDRLTGTFTLIGVGPTLAVHPAGVIMTITGGAGRFQRASGTLLAAPLITPLVPFTPPVLSETLKGPINGYITY